MQESARDKWGERLPRRLGLFSAAAVLVGTTIGSGIFRTPAVVAQHLDVVWLFWLGWVLGGVLALAGALTYGEMAAMYPRSGGIYVYIREAFGDLPAFLFGWAELLVIRPASFGAISITSAEYFWRVVGVDGATGVLSLPVSYAQATAALFIVMVAAVNYRGAQAGAAVQNVSTVLKVAALVLLVLVGFALGGNNTPAGPATTSHGLSAFSALGLAMVSILWAYDGWADVAFVSGEVRDPQRTLPRALFLGTAAIVVLYMAANAVYLHVVPLDRMADSPLIAADAAEAVLGAAGVMFISVAVMVSTFGSLNGSMMTGPRIFYAMADDGLFFKKVAAIHPQFGSPAAAIVLASTLGVVFVSIKTFGQLADQFVIGIWPFYALAVGAVFVLRKRNPGMARPYRAFGYPVVPALFLVAALFLLGNYLVREPLTFLADFGVIFLGVPVYQVWVKGRA